MTRKKTEEIKQQPQPQQSNVLGGALKWSGYVPSVNGNHTKCSANGLGYVQISMVIQCDYKNFTTETRLPRAARAAAASEVYWLNCVAYVRPFNFISARAHIVLQRIVHCVDLWMSGAHWAQMEWFDFFPRILRFWHCGNVYGSPSIAGAEQYRACTFSQRN